jgi:predicted nucleic acid-binding protein
LTRFLLDTNIISEFTKPVRSRELLAWLGDRDDEELFISAFSIAEIRRGILILPSGKRRRDLEHWFEGADGPQMLFAGRVLSFDERAATIWAELMAEGQARGKPRGALDTIIGAIALANNCVLVTNNVKDFAGIGTFNPMKP